MDNQQNSQSTAPQEAQQASPSKAPMMYIVIIVLVVLAGGVFIAKQKSSAPKTESNMEERREESTESKDEKMMEKGDEDKKNGEEMSKDEKSGKSESEEDAMTADFEVEGGMFYFKPNILKVKLGQKVDIEFNNKEGFHDLVIDEFKVKTKQIKAGAKDDISFVADKKGTFEFYCSVGDHRAKGMKGKLIVE